MIERGAFRSIYCALVDGPDFQAFSPGAKLVFYTLKMTLGPSGIDVVPALVPTLVERTGADEKNVEKALAQLEKAGWVKRERNIVWIVDGLRHEPSFSLANQNHRQKVRAHLDGLPRLAIVDAFRAHYSIAAPPAEMPSASNGTGINDGAEMPSKMGTKMASKDPSKITEDGRGTREEGAGKTETASAARRRRGGDGHRSNAGRPTWLTPFADAWKARNGGTMGAGKSVQSLAKLIEDHGADEVLRRWVIYLAAWGEYASAPKFAETWGHWDKPVLRHERAATANAPTPRDQSRVEAGNLVAQIREKITEINIPGQGTRRVLRAADVYAMGDDIAAAFRTVGGSPRFTDAKADDLSFLIGDFAAALSAARLEIGRSRTAPPSSLPHEAQSA